MRTHGKATGAWARDVAHFGHWAPRYERSLLQRVFLTPIQTATIAEIGREVSQLRIPLTLDTDSAHKPITCSG